MLNYEGAYDGLYIYIYRLSGYYMVLIDCIPSKTFKRKIFPLQFLSDSSMTARSSKAIVSIEMFITITYYSIIYHHNKSEIFSMQKSLKILKLLGFLSASVLFRFLSFCFRKVLSTNFQIFINDASLVAVKKPMKKIWLNISDSMYGSLNKVFLKSN